MWGTVGYTIGMATKKKTTDPVPETSRELYPVTVGGEEYMVRQPKGYLGILIAERFQDLDGKEGDDFDASEFLESIHLLVRTIFTKADAAKVRERLADPDDVLDMSDLMDAFGELSEKVSKNPTM